MLIGHPLPELFAKDWQESNIRLMGIGRDGFKTARRLRINRQDQYCLLLVLAGQADARRAGNTFTLTRGEGAVLPPDQAWLLELVCDQAGMVEVLRANFQVLTFGPVDDPLRRLALPQVIPLGVAADHLLEHWPATGPAWPRLDYTDALHWRIRIEAALLHYLQAGFASGQLQSREQDLPDWLRALRYHLGGQIQQPGCTLQELADWAGYSPAHVVKEFKRCFGQPPMRFLRQLRLTLAARLLLATPESRVSDIARRCGYRQLALFSRHFRQFMGCSALTYRRQNRR